MVFTFENLLVSEVSRTEMCGVDVSDVVWGEEKIRSVNMSNKKHDATKKRQARRDAFFGF
jgi:hypothetical protein